VKQNASRHLKDFLQEKRKKKITSIGNNLLRYKLEKLT
jgi:hypothetical protein